MENIVWTVITVLVALWLLGLVMSFGGAFIHILLVVAAIGLVYNLITRGRPTV